jgi:hypothetical protein
MTDRQSKRLELFLHRSERLELDVTFMSALRDTMPKGPTVSCSAKRHQLHAVFGSSLSHEIAVAYFTGDWNCSSTSPTFGWITFNGVRPRGAVTAPTALPSASASSLGCRCAVNPA